MSPLQPLSAPLAAPIKNPKLTKVAQQFEAIFVRQMLAEARKSHLATEDDTLGGQGMDTFRQMQDDRFADIAAERGSFGLAKMIEAQLARQVSPASPSRLREGLGEGLLSSSSEQALPRPLPQAEGEIPAPTAANKET